MHWKRTEQSFRVSGLLKKNVCAAMHIRLKNPNVDRIISALGLDKKKQRVRIFVLGLIK